MKQYKNLVRTVLDHGHMKPTRNSDYVISRFNHNYTHWMDEGFPLLTTKKVSWKNIVAENLWFLSGEPNIDILRRHKCKFWDAWADEDGCVPSPYGYHWCNFQGKFVNRVDQIDYAIETLRQNPDSRRAVVSAWEPETAHYSSLPPCHVMFILNSQSIAGGRYLNLHLTQRSADIALGVPYNLAGYSLLLHIFARILKMRPGQFAHSIVDAHIYYDHIEGLEEQIVRPLRKLPELTMNPELKTLNDFVNLASLPTDEMMSNFVLEGYDPHPAIKFEVTV